MKTLRGFHASKAIGSIILSIQNIVRIIFPRIRETFALISAYSAIASYVKVEWEFFPSHLLAIDYLNPGFKSLNYRLGEKGFIHSAIALFMNVTP